MKQKTNKMLIFTSLAAYFTYFIHGIGASILGQYLSLIHISEPTRP